MERKGKKKTGRLALNTWQLARWGRDRAEPSPGNEDLSLENLTPRSLWRYPQCTSQHHDCDPTSGIAAVSSKHGINKHVLQSLWMLIYHLWHDIRPALVCSSVKFNAGVSKWDNKGSKPLQSPSNIRPMLKYWQRLWSRGWKDRDNKSYTYQAQARPLLTLSLMLYVHI